MSGMLSSPSSLAKEFQEHAKDLSRRRTKGNVWLAVFYAATVISVSSLAILIVNILDGAFGLVALHYQTEPSDLDKDGVSIFQQSQQGLIEVLREQTAVFLEDSDKGISPRRLDALSFERPLEERSVEDLLSIIETEVLHPDIERSWNLFASLFDRGSIEAWVSQAEAEEGYTLRLEFRSWVNLAFIGNAQSPDANVTGIRTAIFGSLFIIVLTIAFAFPIGVGAAIYLEEFANRKSRFYKIIQVNIYNLAGVPSIIYGILGLAIFVRVLTDWAGFEEGRTILSASLTLALLILPIIIINSQEAIRGVPQSLRDSSFGVGATRWQTVWHHVLPACFDRILTGTILAVSRAIGETAPLVVVGASTFIQDDPNGLLSKFTTLPIQIYQWTARPQVEFKNVAAAAIIVLLVLLLTMNAAAIIMRNRISNMRRLQ